MDDYRATVVVPKGICPAWWVASQVANAGSRRIGWKMVGILDKVSALKELQCITLSNYKMRLMEHSACVCLCQMLQVSSRHCSSISKCSIRRPYSNDIRIVSIAHHWMHFINIFQPLYFLHSFIIDSHYKAMGLLLHATLLELGVDVGVEEKRASIVDSGYFNNLLKHFNV